MSNTLVDADELTLRLAQAHPPDPSWKLEVKLEAEPPTVGIHLLEGTYRHAILVTHLRGGAPGSAPWSLMYNTAAALYGMLLEQGLSSRSLPQGDEVGFNGATYRIVIEFTWAG